MKQMWREAWYRWNDMRFPFAIIGAMFDFLGQSFGKLVFKDTPEK